MLHDPKHDLDQTSLDILAATELLEKGWCQNVYQTTPDDGIGVSYCAAGALMRAVGSIDNSGSYERLDAASNRVAGYLPNAYHANLPLLAIERYNDAEGRTKDEMVALFKTAAMGKV